MCQLLSDPSYTNHPVKKKTGVIQMFPHFNPPAKGGWGASVEEEWRLAHEKISGLNVGEDWLKKTWISPLSKKLSRMTPVILRWVFKLKGPWLGWVAQETHASPPKRKNPTFFLDLCSMNSTPSCPPYPSMHDRVDQRHGDQIKAAAQFLASALWPDRAIDPSAGHIAVHL